MCSAGFSEAPNPRKSGISSAYLSASAGATRAQSCEELGKPCSSVIVSGAPSALAPIRRTNTRRRTPASGSSSICRPPTSPRSSHVRHYPAEPARGISARVSRVSWPGARPSRPHRARVRQAARADLRPAGRAREPRRGVRGEDRARARRRRRRAQRRGLGPPAADRTAAAVRGDRHGVRRARADRLPDHQGGVPCAATSA